VTRPRFLIVGGGPVGLSAALALGRAGIRCLVLERRDEFSRYPGERRPRANHGDLSRMGSCQADQGADGRYAGRCHHRMEDSAERLRDRPNFGGRFGRGVEPVQCTVP